jgi:osmotically-inducible protein OsmY
MKSNSDLQKDVQDAIKWEPLLNAAEIGVIAKDGVVTLTGTVDSYFKKTEAESAAKSVDGVMAVVEEIKVKYPDTWGQKSDTDIANEIINAFSWSWKVPNDKVKAKVEKGWVTLAGEVSWHYQKEAAGDAVKNLVGVIGLSNNITIKPETQNDIEKKDIESALKRSRFIDDMHIKVKASGHKAVLTGTVGSLYEKGEAARIAWNAPGIWEVDNELVVRCD